MNPSFRWAARVWRLCSLGSSAGSEKPWMMQGLSSLSPPPPQQTARSPCWRTGRCSARRSGFPTTPTTAGQPGVQPAVPSCWPPPGSAGRGGRGRSARTAWTMWWGQGSAMPAHTSSSVTCKISSDQFRSVHYQLVTTNILYCFLIIIPTLKGEYRVSNNPLVCGKWYYTFSANNENIHVEEAGLLNILE